MLAVAGLVGAGCNGLLGIHPLDGGADSALDGGPTACGVSAGTSACAQCMQASCCEQAHQCAADEGCQTYEDCALGCASDYACKSQCLITQLAAAPEIPALDTCVATSCNDACGLKSGITLSVAEPDAAAGCAQCLASVAGDKVQACMTNLACQTLEAEGLECTTADCVDAVSESNDAGVTLLFSYLRAVQASCTSACSLGSYWDCPAVEPFNPLPQTTITLGFVLSDTQAPLSGASVTACAEADMECKNSIGAGTTDALGLVTFVFDNVTVGYFEVVQPESIYPTLVFLQHGFSVSNIPLYPVAVSPSTVVDDSYKASGASWDPGKGTMATQSLDCHWYPAGGTTVKADFGDGGVSFTYFVGDQLTTSASATASSGYAVLLNTPVERSATISVTPEALGSVKGTGIMFARAGWVSAMAVGPR